MEQSWQHWWRLRSLLVVLALLAAACVENAELPLCASAVIREPTGDLAVDLVGAWSGTTGEGGWHHPIAYLAGRGEEGDPPRDEWTGGRIWMFRDDGTGHVWWVNNDPRIANENDVEFVWEVVDGELAVNDLPPATVEVRSPTRALIHPIDESVDPLSGVGVSRCDLSVPEGVEGLDA
jgi:hypothetical protein